MPRRARVKQRRRARRRTRLEELHLFKVSLVRDFVAAHGWGSLTRDVNVSNSNLYGYVTNSRIRYRVGTITDEVVRALEAIPGWTWEPVRDRYRADLEKLRKLVKRVGWQGLPSAGDEGRRLAWWCRNRRAEHKRGELARWLRDALQAIPGWSWEPVDDQYEVRIGQLRTHVAAHGWEGLSKESEDPSVAILGRWMNWVRYLYRRNRLPDWVLLELSRVDGWTWEPIDELQRRKLDVFRAYVARSGWTQFRFTLKVDGIAIGSWVNSCLARQRRGELPAWLCRELEAIPGWKWRGTASRRLDRLGRRIRGAG